MSIEILAEQDEWFAVLKPAGIAFHSDDEATGFVELVRQEKGAQCFPVHRLDKVTSGILLFAKTAEANSEFSRQFRNSEINKLYLALSDKKPKKKQGWIKGDMEKARNGSYKLVRSQLNPAVTRFSSSSFEGERGRQYLFLLQPHTGKTHQLRVALKSIGSPILGDERYAGGNANRCLLHAWQLRFMFKGVKHTITAPHHWGGDVDAKMQHLYDKLQITQD